VTNKTLRITELKKLLYDDSFFSYLIYSLGIYDVVYQSYSCWKIYRTLIICYNLPFIIRSIIIIIKLIFLLFKLILEFKNGYEQRFFDIIQNLDENEITSTETTSLKDSDKKIPLKQKVLQYFFNLII